MDIAISAGLLILCRCISAYDKVNRCPLLGKDTWKNRGKEVCKSSFRKRYHCFKSIDGSFVEMCITPREFRFKECPYFDPKSSSYFKFRKCDEIYGQCPPDYYYKSNYIYRYSACLYSPTTVVHSSSDNIEGMTQPTTSDRKQTTTRIVFNVTATSEHEIKYVTILEKLDENQKTQESSMIFGSEIFKGIMALTGGMIIASVCFVIYVIKRKNEMDLRMAYSNTVGFRDNTENVFDDIAETPLEIQITDTPSLEQLAYLEPHERLHFHAETSCHRLDVSEKENTDMQICDVDVEKADNHTEVNEVKDTAPSPLSFL